jgi:DNA polymerase III delta prime subunit
MSGHNKIISMPWVEKYRPSIFDDIVLNSINKEVCNNIIEKEYFPNLLFYGPPGTGKTTTIINLVTSYQCKVDGDVDKSLMIHLNASDDRGIDIIRNQILQFVNSKCLFKNGLKFVILDEVDYMTKNAQQALRYLINVYRTNVRFCLICNYISRIDDGLQTEFLKIRFNNLPQNDIGKFLKNIVTKENINLSDEKIDSIQKLYGSDIRSMINFIQCNHLLDNNNINIINDNIWNKLTSIIKNNASKKTNNYNAIFKYLRTISIGYNITVKNIVKDYFTYLIKYQKIDVTPEFLSFIEKLIHTTDCTNTSFLYYTFVNLERFSTLL